MTRRNRGDGPLRRVFRYFTYAVAIIVLIFCCRYAYNFGLKIFSDEGMEPEPGVDYTIQVEAGTSINDLGKELQKYGIIEDSTVFYIQSIIYEVKTVKPGTYIFNNSLSGEKLLGVVSAGPEEEKEEQK